jgi:uncharacterized alkaline shock family protein YloU
MTDLDKGRSGNGGDAPHPEVRAAPFFPGPGGRTAGVPLSAPPTLPAPTSVPMPQPARDPAGSPAGVGGPPPAGNRESEEQPGHSGGGDAAPVGTTATVKGRVTIMDEVVEKIAMLAALEVGGVAALSGGPGTAGPGQAGPGVRVHLQDNTVTLDLAIAVEYSSVIMEVAKAVKSNVAHVIGLMTGMRVPAVNVSVQDVRMPAEGGGS